MFPDKISAVEQALAAQLHNRQFAENKPFGMFKIELEQLLVSITGDSNFELHFNNADLTFSNTTTLDGFPDSYIIETEILPGNVGYLNLQGNFLDLKALPDIQYAMTQFTSSKALLVDIRQSGEANLPLVQKLLSYWLAPDTIISELQLNDASQSLHNIPLESPLHYNRRGKTWLLTSPFVLGTWELFAYTLQQQGMAKVVGMDTMGLAILTKQVRLSKHTRITLAHAIPTDPVSGKNWYQTGVSPDYFVEMENALEVAHDLAVQADSD
ncbi:S41 family peptidase [Planctobacterium marinum]|uniref:Interphotoreceptor retinoid-binding protein n=1 Tax=Planctobacterium marinum TaxID=1631968 RepID=A0AA48KU34_9ALTE|nr:interphotoreceptor retinoid-binding protein [Planctobacterium marinum]